MHRLLTLVCATCLGVISPVAARAQLYATVAESDDTVRLLDEDLVEISFFPAGAPDPNAITTDGAFLYTGHSAPNQVVTYDLQGNVLGAWPVDGPITGLAHVEGQLAISGGSAIEFRDPWTGVLEKRLPNPPCGPSQGLAYDGRVLWVLCNQLTAIDLTTGIFEKSEPNPAAACNLSGTAFDAIRPSTFVVGCDDGTWYLQPRGGLPPQTGNNGIDMKGIAALGDPCDPLCFVDAAARGSLKSKPLGSKIEWLQNVSVDLRSNGTFRLEDLDTGDVYGGTWEPNKSGKKFTLTLADRSSAELAGDLAARAEAIVGSLVTMSEGNKPPKLKVKAGSGGKPSKLKAKVKLAVQAPPDATAKGKATWKAEGTAP